MYNNKIILTFSLITRKSINERILIIMKLAMLYCQYVFNFRNSFLIEIFRDILIHTVVTRMQYIFLHICFTLIGTSERRMCQNIYKSPQHLTQPRSNSDNTVLKHYASCTYTIALCMLHLRHVEPVTGSNWFLSTPSTGKCFREFHQRYHTYQSFAITSSHRAI